MLPLMVRATVRNGRLLLDEPTELPEGSVVDVGLEDEGDDLDDRNCAALHDAISRSIAEGEQGRSGPADEILRKLRERRKP